MKKNTYKNQLVKTTIFQDGTQTEVQISRDDKKHMTLDEIRNIYDGIVEQSIKKGENIRVLVRGTGQTNRGFTIKGYDDEFMTDEAFEDYWGNIVKNSDKFDDFFNASFIVWKTKNVAKK
jgi:hypothetical protein